jgi:hypothetical protein
MSTLDAIDFLRSSSEGFYHLDMPSPNSDNVEADAILRQIDAEAGSVSIEVTLYLPRGVRLRTRA